MSSENAIVDQEVIGAIAMADATVRMLDLLISRSISSIVALEALGRAKKEVLLMKNQVNNGSIVNINNAWNF